MRTALLPLLLLLASSALAQPDPYPNIRVIQATVSPMDPTTADTLTVTYQFIAPSACNYISDWQVEGTPARRQLHVRVTLPPTAKCTTDKEAKRTATMRIPPLPAGDYQLMMNGNWRVEGHQFKLGGKPVLFTVRER
ncbi:MAG: hypothetical protein JNL43_09580 [Flavobacteriales bacterium]|nr:hypothetical protein [Flavobacteriales bacterium]